MPRGLLTPHLALVSEPRVEACARSVYSAAIGEVDGTCELGRQLERLVAVLLVQIIQVQLIPLLLS